MCDRQPQPRYSLALVHQVIFEFRGLVMSKKSRSFLLFSLIPAFLVVSVFAVLGAQEGRAQSVRQTNWSDPATWPNRKVPAAGDKVTIASDQVVVLDVNTPALGGLSIDGKLTFSNNADVELSTEWIMLHGELEIGTEARPHTRKATITLTNNVKDEEMMGMGDRGIMLSGGTLNLHGDRTNAWTKLSKTAEAGSTVIQVLDATGWRAGDEIVLASTDFDPRQADLVDHQVGRRVVRDRDHQSNRVAQRQFQPWRKMS